ncbi:MAG TPA: hypothetical protein PKN24_14320 [bacterium]|nr:hypothetical protein [bacterium]
MKWMNKQEQIRAIARALALTLITLLLVFAWLKLGTSLPTKGIEKAIVIEDRGPEIMDRYPASVDTSLLSLGASYLPTRIADKSLAAGTRLFRLGVCKQILPKEALIDQLKKNGCRFYWQEAGQNYDYRILYCATNPEQIAESELLTRLKEANSSVATGRVIIEKVMTNSDELLALDSIN